MEKENQEHQAAPTYRDRLKSKYPDVPIEKDDDYNALSERYFNESEETLGKYKDSEKAVAELIDSDPDLKSVLTEMLVNGAPFRVAIAKFISDEDLKPKEGEDDYEAYQKVRSERLATAAKRAEQEKEIAENELESSNLFETFCNENNIGEEERDAFMQIVNDSLFALLHKKVDKKFLELCLKGSRFEKAVSDAEKIGEVNGRNTAIEAKKAKETDVQQGDGIPVPQGSAGKISSEKKTRINPLFQGIVGRKTI